MLNFLAESGVPALDIPPLGVQAVANSASEFGEYGFSSGEATKPDRDMLIDGRVIPMDGGDMAAECGSVIMLGLGLYCLRLLSKYG